MAKKVTFGARPNKGPATAEQWIETGTTEEEPMKRFTIDVPESLHRRIKMQCAARGSVMADEIRALLAKHFPEGKP